MNTCHAFAVRSLRRRRGYGSGRPARFRRYRRRQRGGPCKPTAGGPTVSVGADAREFSGDMEINAGLPAGTTIQIDSSLDSFAYNNTLQPVVNLMSFTPNLTGRQPGALGGRGWLHPTPCCRCR